MQRLRSAWPRSGRVAAWLSVAACSAIVGVGPMAIGQEAAPRPTPLELRHSLEGMRFVGPLAIEGETDPSEDLLTFEDGRFSSRTCLQYGFAPAPYWVRRDAEGLRFRADLESPEHGTIRFEGVFDGTAMVATARWTKKRWYWTVEQTFRFTGRPSGRAD